MLDLYRCLLLGFAGVVALAGLVKYPRLNPTYVSAEYFTETSCETSHLIMLPAKENLIPSVSLISGETVLESGQ